MALPGHSPPPPFTGPGSPTRMLNGHVDSQLPPMYGPSAHPMLPPSPHNYRFPNPPPIPTPSPSLSTIIDNRNTVPYKRPGSSMSISSMLGGDPERSTQEPYLNQNSRGFSRQGSIPAPSSNSFSIMSPPQQPSKPGLGEYAYKPRSRTPDRIGAPFNTAGPRQRSSSSGTPLQRSGPFGEQHVRSASTVPAPRYFEQSPSLGYNSDNTSRNEQDDRVRRTSLSAILQRPNSQPQSGQHALLQQESFNPNTVAPTTFDQQLRPESAGVETFQRNGAVSTYDIKPPGPHNFGRPNGLQISPVRGPSLPTSPELRRTGANTSQGRTLASILNGPSAQTTETTNMAGHKMARQDSAHSQGDRSIYGDRQKFRPYSPFAGSSATQSQSNYGAPVDEQGRKGSDELSQHRALLGLAAESKRGRYSPMPQVMQGAQARTPVPDAGVKTEHGRVFSGLGGGISSVPAGNSAKRDEERTPLSEDNLMKMSRNGSGLTKRSRKVVDEDTTVDAEAINGGKVVNGKANKKGKYQHSYKVDLEELATQGAQRRNTPLTGLSTIRNTTASTINPSGTGNTYHSQSQRVADPIPTLKPKKTIKVASVFNTVSRAPRRHLGNFTYRPEVAQSECQRSGHHKFDVSIRPNLLPTFSAAEHVNCTYTIHVPKLWLHDKERSLICSEQYLWGSGIYTDDSDPVAAAIHAGFLKASFGETIDTSLLSRVIQEQNPKIEWPKDLKIPAEPMDIKQGKDLNITLVVLPVIERYEGSVRYGVKSRTWPDGLERTQHDGVSFGILKVEFASIGTEELRMGRTGTSRRERLRTDLIARQRGLQIQGDRITKAKQKRFDQLKLKAAGSIKKSKLGFTSVPNITTNGVEVSVPRPIEGLVT